MYCTMARDDMRPLAAPRSCEGRRQAEVGQRRDVAKAAVVPMDDLELLQKLEDRLDHEAIHKALAEPGKRMSYRTFRKTLGL